ncbi:hypothetical protein SAMN05192588_1300 [Nonlabens sp. Hel1_33_55]|uniref:hypothetical protein n=1 Tax=Nonlabens sp. Hel1_33_55 TaxID=1336802 RepID=UPI000875CF5C|nr:hypothetical protein [Nonlabens sp. Hel1_33_55]SCY13157.1 hypothetical protein SAMN05192588_1300 [Nonlabens sp. Hel1_33_55]
MSRFYPKSDLRTLLYAALRIGLGLYLLIHAVIGLMDMDNFMLTALSYLEEDSSIAFLAYLTPIIPFMEFFLAVMILTGIYTKAALQWATGIGVFFMLMFHYLDDFPSALEHAYTVVIKLTLIIGIYYNKFSLDYYNLWNVKKEVKTIEQKPQ